MVISLPDIDVPESFLNNWQKIADLSAQFLDVPVGLIMKVKAPYIEVFVSSQTKDNPYHVGDKEILSGLYCNRVIENQNSLLVPNAPEDPEWNQNPDIKLGMISYLGFPVNWPDGRPFGTICVLDSKPNKYNASYKSLLQQFKSVLENELKIIIQNYKYKLALDKIAKLKSLLPVCSYCKKIQVQDNEWINMEEFFQGATGTHFSHGACPICEQQILNSLE